VSVRLSLKSLIMDGLQ